MEIKAITKHVRITPRKVRLVGVMIKGLSVNKAFDLLKFDGRRAASLLQKTLKSAAANAIDRTECAQEDLMVLNVIADDGPTMKRFIPRAMGRGTKIRKRTSHITVVVLEKQKKQKVEVISAESAKRKSK